MNLRIIDKSGISDISSICTAFIYGHGSKLHSNYMMQSNGSGENCANSFGSHLSVDLTISQHQFRQCIVLIHHSVNITVVKITFSRGNPDIPQMVDNKTHLLCNLWLQFSSSLNQHTLPWLFLNSCEMGLFSCYL